MTNGAMIGAAGTARGKIYNDYPSTRYSAAYRAAKNIL
jgi:hypothetical protein